MQAVSLDDVLVGCYSVTVRLRTPTNSESNSSWWLTSVYGPQEDAEKVVFLEELEAIRDACPGPWALTGDFNLILNEADKSNHQIDRANLRRFRQCVANLHLPDLHLHGRCFTWSNERDNPTLMRLDRVLVSMDWDETFPNSHLRGLGSDASDNCPLLLHTNMGTMTKARFHFEVFWPKFNDYEDTIQAAWQHPSTTCGPLHRLDNLLRTMVCELQRWSATKIGGIRDQLLMARELIHRLDLAQESRQLSEAESEL